jgi:integrase
VTCLRCGTPLPAGGRRDRLYCTASCRNMAYAARRGTGEAPAPRWQHPALTSENPALQAAAVRARDLGAAHGWSPSTILPVIDGLAAVLAGRAAGAPARLTEVRAAIPRQASSTRVAEVLTGLGLLDDDTTPPIRAWVERRSAELPAGFADGVRAWLLVLLDGDARARPRSHSSVYAYFGGVRPHLESWAVTRGHLREVTAADVVAALDPLRGWPRSNAIAALRSLFRFAKRRGLVFADPTTRLRAAAVDRSVLPMTDAEIRAVEQAAVTPAQRLVVALAAVHAARGAAIRHLTLDDLDLPNRRITLAGHAQHLGEAVHRLLLTWLDHRRASWPHTPNRHVLVSGRTALGTVPVTADYLKCQLADRGIHLERIRADRVLHEAMTAGPDPLHLALVFNLSHTTAGRYAAIAQKLLDDHPE